MDSSDFPILTVKSFSNVEVSLDLKTFPISSSGLMMSYKSNPVRLLPGDTLKVFPYGIEINESKSE